MKEKIKEKAVLYILKVTVVILVLSALISSYILVCTTYRIITEYGWVVLFSPKWKMRIIKIAWEHSVLFRVTYVSFFIAVASSLIGVHSSKAPWA